MHTIGIIMECCRKSFIEEKWFKKFKYQSLSSFWLSRSIKSIPLLSHISRFWFRRSIKSNNATVIPHNFASTSIDYQQINIKFNMSFQQNKLQIIIVSIIMSRCWDNQGNYCYNHHFSILFKFKMKVKNKHQLQLSNTLQICSKNMYDIITKSCILM